MLRDLRGNRPRHYYGSMPVSNGRKFLRGRPQLKIGLGVVMIRHGTQQSTSRTRKTRTPWRTWLPSQRDRRAQTKSSREREKNEMTQQSTRRKHRPRSPTPPHGTQQPTSWPRRPRIHGSALPHTDGGTTDTVRKARGRTDETKRCNNQPPMARKHCTHNSLRIRGKGEGRSRR